METIDNELQAAQAADKQAFADASPKGKFSKAALNSLVAATNKLLPAFQQEPDYPTFDADLTELPGEFTRVLSMFAAASTDAAAADRVDEELAITLDGVVDDTGLKQLAGKINMLARDRMFKQFLQEDAPEEEEEVTEVQEEEVPMTEEDEEALFMERM